MPLPQYDVHDGLALALAYLQDPTDVPCPTCGPGTVEVVAYLDSAAMAQGEVVHVAPEGDYAVILHCHGCGRSAALDLAREDAA